MESEQEKGKQEKRKQIIVVMASQRRAIMKLGRVTFSPETTSGEGPPRFSRRGLPKRERDYMRKKEFNEIFYIRPHKGREVRNIKTQIY